MAIVETVPNISEGRDLAAVRRIVDALRAVPGLQVLDVQSDATHHRSVLTLAGDRQSVKEGVLRLYEEALAIIDLRGHRGERRRIGAVDVCPFIPIEGISMGECVDLAREVGAAVARRYQLPVFLYEEAASDPARRNLEDIRRGEFEGLDAKLARPEWSPDFGPAQKHPTAGASVIGARMPLIAYNINLNTDRIDVAKKVAAAIRHSSGGLRYVKAMGFEVDGQAQVSMNLVDPLRVGPAEAYDAVAARAPVAGAELVGLVPGAVLDAVPPDRWPELDLDRARTLPA